MALLGPIRTARLNARLASLGYAVQPGRSYSPSTTSAVMAFQKVHGLARDGIAGVETLRALRTPRTLRFRSTPDRRVVIDLSEQVLYVVRRGRAELIVNASTGNPGLPDGRGAATPLGTFRVGRKFAGVEQAELGALHWPSYFHGGIAVHGGPQVPATPQSHGCVRVPIPLARRMFETMRAGMVVQVRP